MRIAPLGRFSREAREPDQHHRSIWLLASPHCPDIQNRQNLGRLGFFNRCRAWRARQPQRRAASRAAATVTVWFSRVERTLHGSLALSLAADVAILPLHTRH
jgi:hypothetical protein